MGQCRYCSTKAGMFRDAHESCAREADAALAQSRSVVADAVSTGKTAEELVPLLQSLRAKGRFAESDSKHALMQAADTASMTLAHDHPVSNEDIERIGAIFRLFDDRWFEDAQRIVNWHGYLSLDFSNVLYQVLHGQVPYHHPDLANGFFLDHNEHPILRRNATLAEYRQVSTGRTYHSMSLPVGGGIYYRIGASAPRTQQTGLVPIDQGKMLITTKAIYFSGTTTTFKLPYSSILRLESFVDAVGVYENHGRGKVFIPGSLGMDDGWFFYNLISALTAQAI